jgi:MYXO-CTERM domain-containing protein
MDVFARRFALAVLVTGSAFLAPLPAAAQDTAITTTTTHREEEDRDFPWGLLGLLGLLGLIPRRKKDVHVHEHAVHEVHTRPVPPRDDRVGGTPPPPRAQP